MEQGCSKSDLLYAGEHLADSGAKRPHLLLECGDHEEHDEPINDVCHCKRDDEDVKAL